MKALQVAAIVLSAVVLTTALAHALELPGKLRLSREQYLAVQPIYYPGFTIAGVAEPLLIVALIALMIATPPGGRFWLVAAFGAFVVVHAIYWVLIHPVNNFWIKDFDLARPGRGLFAFGAQDQSATDWTALRDRWEYAHLARAVVALIGFMLLVSAAVSG
jgi:anthrone oxygenase-like protein